MNITSYGLSPTTSSPKSAFKQNRRRDSRRANDCGHDCAALDHGLELLAYARDKLRSASSAAQVAQALELETEAINVVLKARSMPTEPKA